MCAIWPFHSPRFDEPNGIWRGKSSAVFSNIPFIFSLFGILTTLFSKNPNLGSSLRPRAHQGNWQPQRNRNFRELLSAWVEQMLLNGAAKIEETAFPFPQFAVLHSITGVQLRLITVLGNCGCVVVSSFLGVPSPLMWQPVSHAYNKRGKYRLVQ
jgi:hypothetical protein